MKTAYKYIRFVKCGNDWLCQNKKHGEDLGLGQYYKAWRQWVIEPFGDCVFNVSCLEDVIHFIKQLGKSKPKED